MAARSFLTDSETQACLQIWKKQIPGQVSEYLQQKLIDKLSKLKSYNRLQIFGMGSVARQELCPQSDIDLLIIGPEVRIKEFMQNSFDVGLKIRARTFTDTKDIFEGAEVFDLLSLSQLFPFTTEAHSSLSAINDSVSKQLQKKRQLILKKLKSEKAERLNRFDSLVNYLEPNLKQGSGGLRDIQQSLYLFEVFPEKLQDCDSNKKILLQNKMRLLNIRQGSHLLGFGDSLVAQAQLDLQQELGFQSISSLMMDVEKLFSDSSFYANWALAKVQNPLPSFRLPNSLGLSFRELLKLLEKDTGEVIQEKLRSRRLIVQLDSSPERDLRRLLHSGMPEGRLMALFGSKMMRRIFSDLKKVEGLVQHDQYHLLTVDAHLKQAMRLAIRARHNPNYFGKKMATIAGHFKKLDWEIIFWSAFFHDLAKGRKGDHSTVGAKLCQKVLQRYQFKQSFIDEVAWIVENHLIFSVAAFRRNPKSAKTLHWLLSRGVKGHRAHRLAFFTALDIYATNASAWNDWKANLLSDLHLELTSSRAKKLEKFLLGLSRNVLTQNLDFYSQLDQRLIAEVSPRVLAADIKKIQSTAKSLDPLVINAGKGRYWIRFHEAQDQDGLFLRYVSSLHACGLSVTEAFVQTFENYGVYDWFLVRGSRKRDSIKKILLLSLQNTKTPEPKVLFFEKIEITEQDDSSAIISFRGIDQKGALLAAAAAVYESNLPIIWAKIVTWGRRLDDVFFVKASLSSLESFRKSSRGLIKEQNSQTRSNDGGQKGRKV